MKLLLLASFVASAFAVLPSVPGLNTPQPTPYPTPAHDTKVAQGLKHAHQFAALGNQKTHKHSNSARGANYKKTTSSTWKPTPKQYIVNTAAPTPNPTPKFIKKVHYCMNGNAKVMVGFKGECAGANYCKQCTCGMVNGKPQLRSNKANQVCGKPSKGSSTCQNIYCTYVNDFVQVHHKKNMLATEGKEHTCKYNRHLNKCSCFCHGTQNKLWHSYSTWYCATKNGKINKSTHIAYKSGTYSPSDKSLIPACSPK